MAATKPKPKSNSVQLGPLTAPSTYDAVIVAACRRIEQSDTPPQLKQLAEDAGLSPYHFHRLFKRVTGVTPKAFGDAQRRHRLRQQLQTEASVTAAIHESGFNSSGRFYATSHSALGMTASAYRRGGAGTVLRFAVGQCSLGAILVAASDKGIAGISLGDNADVLVRDFQDQFANATLIGGDANFESVTARVIGLIETPTQAFDLPLDIAGTIFQLRVWEALRKIPAAKTATYAEIAQAIGEPKAARAVAAACAANRIAVAIPCHRVVRSDGSLSGYRWGVDRKRTLLAREAEAGQTAATSAAKKRQRTP